MLGTSRTIQTVAHCHSWEAKTKVAKKPRKLRSPNQNPSRPGARSLHRSLRSSRSDLSRPDSNEMTKALRLSEGFLFLTNRLKYTLHARRLSHVGEPSSTACKPVRASLRKAQLYPTTSIPMDRAVPLILLIAVSIEAAFRSGIFCVAISRTCFSVTLPTLSLLGEPEPF